MERQKLIEISPRLYHMAEAGSWDSVKSHGLLSTSRLLDLWDIKGDDRRSLESAIRPQSVAIDHPEHGRAVIRDNKPLRRDNLVARLDQMTVEEWCEMLNRHAFFWPTEDHLRTLLNARAYKKLEHDVITVDTARLIAACGDQVRLSPINSGNTIYPPKRTYGKDTFLPIDDYPYEERRAERGKRDAIVEVAVRGGVADIASLAVRVERRRGDEILGISFEG